MFGVRAASANLLNDWNEAHVKMGISRGQGALGACSWIKSSDGWIKINIDAAVLLCGSIGVGGVARD